VELNTPTCVYHALEGPVQEFVLTATSRQAVDDLFDMMEKLLADGHARKDLSIIAGAYLIDSRIGMLPLNYAFMRARATAQKFPTHPQSRTAVIFSPSPLVKTVGFFLRAFGATRIYGPQEREAALTWLRAKEWPR
jgi:hypothetical protein